MIKPCPYCGEYSSGYSLVEIIEGKDGTDQVNIHENDSPKIDNIPSFETTTCIVFNECGHAYERESVKRVLDALKEFRGLRRELQKTEDPERYWKLKDYKLPTQKNIIKNRRSEMVRREEAESIDG